MVEMPRKQNIIVSDERLVGCYDAEGAEFTGPETLQAR